MRGQNLGKKAAAVATTLLAMGCGQAENGSGPNGPGGKADGVFPSLSTIELESYVHCRGALDETTDDLFFAVDSIACEAGTFDQSDAVQLDSVMVAVGDDTLSLDAGESDEIRFSAERTEYPLTVAMAVIFNVGSETYATEQRTVVNDRAALAQLLASPPAPVEVWQVAFYPSPELYQSYANGSPYYVGLAFETALPVLTEEISAFAGFGAAHTLPVRLYTQANATAGQSLEETIMVTQSLVVPAGSESIPGQSRVGDATATSTLEGSAYYVIGLDGTLRATAASDLPTLALDQDAGVVGGDGGYAFSGDASLPSGDGGFSDGGFGDDSDAGAQSAPSLACEARDRDGRNPWILTVQNEASTIRVEATTMENLEQCNAAAADALAFAGARIACIPKDNDGRNPWTLAVIDASGGLMKVDASVTSYDDCLSTLSAGTTPMVSGAAVFRTCGSRDNDARAPYVSLDIGTSRFERTDTEEHSTLDACLAALAP